jgi:survival-of-motor-neuron-related-splicing factor 30
LLAVWSEDGEWYTATVKAVTPIGYIVTYDDWGNTEENVMQRQHGKP